MITLGLFSASSRDEDHILGELSSYPLCNISGHHSDSTPHTHDAAAPTVIARAVLPDDFALVPSSLVSTPNVPSPSLTTPVHIDENPTEVLLLDNMSVPVSLYRAHQMATENVRDSVTSPDPAAASAARTNSPARTTCETSMSTSSVPAHAAVSPQNSADLLIHSGAPAILSSASSKPVLDGMTGPSLLTTCLLPQSLIAQY
jgi:hypothetical protein